MDNLSIFHTYNLWLSLIQTEKYRYNQEIWEHLYFYVLCMVQIKPSIPASVLFFTYLRRTHALQTYTRRWWFIVLVNLWYSFNISIPDCPSAWLWVSIVKNPDALKFPNTGKKIADWLLGGSIQCANIQVLITWSIMAAVHKFGSCGYDDVKYINYFSLFHSHDSIYNLGLFLTGWHFWRLQKNHLESYWRLNLYEKTYIT